jgi:hypothetical protein
MTQSDQIRAEVIVLATQKLGGDLVGVKRIVRLIQEKRADPVYVEYVLEHGRWIDSLSSDEYLCLLKAIAGSSLENASAVIKSFFMWNHSLKPIEGELAEFAWKCLEAANTHDEAYKCDKLALQLAQTNIARGFALLENILLKQSTDYRFWNPVNSNEQRELWNFLYSFNRKRAVTVPLQAALQDLRKPSLISWHLQRVIDQKENSDLLIEFALQSEEQAEVICDVISVYKENFWCIAFNILENYPNSQNIKDALFDISLGLDYSKSRLENLENSLNRVESVLSGNTMPFAARVWLEELESYLRTKIEEEHNPELEIVNGRESIDKSYTDAQKIWAIKTLLRDGETEKIRKLLSKNELNAVLSLPDFSELEKEKLRGIFES